MKRIDEETEETETPEEELDLVDLMKRMETDFHKGVPNTSIHNASPGESLRDSYEFDSYNVQE